jgi:hypothetical protein
MGALDPERLAFDSSWSDVGIIYDKGSVAVPAVPAPGYVQVNFADALPNPPFVICFRKLASNVMRLVRHKGSVSHGEQFMKLPR